MKKSFIILSALLLVMGCENGGGRSNPPLNFLVGTWDVVEFSTDDGNTWDAETDNPKYEFRNDGRLVTAWKHLRKDNL